MRNSSKIQPAICFSPKADEKLKEQIDQLSYYEDSLIQRNLKNIILVLNCSCETIGEIVKLLKSVNKELGESEAFCQRDDAIQLFCNLYLYCFSKFPYKKLFSSILLNPVWNVNDLSNCLCNSLTKILCYDEEIHLPKLQVIYTLEHVYQTFPKIITSLLWQKSSWYVAKALKMHREALETLPENLSGSIEESIQNICSDLKCATVLFQCDHRGEHNSNDITVSHFEDSDLIQALTKETSNLLQQDNLGWECWNSAGFLHSLLAVSSPANSLYQLEQKLDWNKVEDGSFSYGAYIGLCNGCLAFLNTTVLKRSNCQKKEEKLTNELTNTTICKPSARFEDVFKLVQLVFTHLIKLAEKIKSVPDQIALAKCFVQWTMTMKCFIKLHDAINWDALDSSLKSLQLYATPSLDHPVDVIRHQAKDIMVNILTIGGSKDEGSISFAHALVRNAFSWDWHKRPVYIFLKCSANFVDVDFILKQDANLIEKLLTACSNQALAPYASQLYSQFAQMYKERFTKQNNGLKNSNLQMDQWLKPTLIHLLNSNPHQSRLLNDYCIPKLLKFYGSIAVPYIISSLKEEDSKRSKVGEKSGFLNCLVMCLRASQRLGLLDKKPAAQNGHESKSASNIDPNLIKSALVHQDNQVRLDSLCLLCESWRSTALISSSDLELIMFCLPYNMTCQCPAFRQELLNTIKKFLHRLLLNLESLRKGKRGKDSESQHMIQAYTDFEFWLLDFCLDNLFEGASYPRKSLALNIFHFLITSHLKSRKGFNHLQKLLSFKRIATLVGLLKDGFDDNRQLSLNILSNQAFKKHVKQSLGCSFLWNLVETSLETGRKSCKPEVCRDAAYNLLLAARLHQSPDKNIVTFCKYFVSSLRYDVRIASKNLIRAAQTGPMHGCLLCLRMLLADANVSDEERFSAYQKLVVECVDLCYQVASAVLPVVGSESPEGGIPEVSPEMELPEVHQRRYMKLLQLLQGQNKPGHENGDSDRISGQRMLVMCWRSAKESYLLLQLISSLASKRFNDGGVALLSADEFLKIGEHLRSQLMDTVHRGTFEVAYSVFRDYCPLLWRSKDPRLNSHPKEWVHETVQDICDAEKAKSVCSTRRSAGLPFFLQALLGSDKSQITHDCLLHVMDSLLPLVSCDVISKLTDDNGCSQQVHSLNVIRGLMKDASLGEDMFPYLSKCVVAAVTGFASTIWKIRNSSTLLFSALMTRIFGVKKEKDLETSGKNRLSSHEFFTRMPELDQFLLEHLKKSLEEKTKVSDIEQDSKLYPVLLLLSRIYPSPSRQQGAVDPLINYRPLLIRCCHSPIYKCRVMAANAVVSGVTSDDSLNMLSHLAKSLSYDLPANQIHGTLLQLHKLFNLRFCDVTNLSKGEKALSALLDTIASSTELGTRKTRCLVNRSAYLNLCVDLASFYFKILKSGNDIALSRSIPTLLEVLLRESIAYHTAPNTYLPGHTMLSESSGRLFASCWIWGITSDSLSYPIRCNDYDVTYSFLRTLKKHFKCKRRCLDLKSTEAAEELEKVLIELISTPLDSRCRSKAFALLALFVSPLRSIQALTLARHHVDDMFWKNDKLVGAVVTCQAACLKTIISESLHCSQNILEWIQEFVTLLENVSSNLRHASNVSLCVADALRTLAVELFPEKSTEPVCTGAWRVLLVLLVDEDEHVRKAATQVVYDVVEFCNIETTSELAVDSLSLEIAMDCLSTLYDSNSRVLQNTLDFLSNLSDQAEEDPLDGAAGLFNRSANNVFIEPPVLKQLVEKTLLRKS